MTCVPRSSTGPPAPWPSGSPPIPQARPRRSCRRPGCSSCATIPPPLAERARLLGSLSRAQGYQRLGEAGPVWERQLGIELQQGGENEAAAADLGVRQRQALAGKLEVAKQEQVDVERAGAVARGIEGPAASHLDLLAEVEQGFGLKRGADADRGVEEVGLVQHLADRFGLVGRGDRLDLDPALAQQLDRRPQVRPTVADVGTEPEVTGPHRSAVQVASASSSSASSPRSWTTSTATSWIANGSGGSGLAARTRTDSQP